MATQTDGGSMMFCNGANWLGFLSFTSAGNLGVWNAAPTVELDITGTGQMDALNLNGVTGLASPASSATFALGDLTNVDTTGFADGEVLTYSAGATGWVSASSSGGGLSADSVLESHLKAVNAATDEYCLTYETTTGDFEWQTCGAGGSLWTAGAGDDIYYNSGTPMVGIGQTNPDVTLDVTGDIEYTGTITDMSDRRLKTDIMPLQEYFAANPPRHPVGASEGRLHERDPEKGNAQDAFAYGSPPFKSADADRGDDDDRRASATPLLAKVTSLQGVSFKMKDDPKGGTEFGFIAQDVQPYFPDLVYERGSGMLSMNYTGLIAPMVEAIKEQQAQIDELKARIEVLEARE